ncbi:9671_t:CDS:1, partial [Entrophospora sp. SA101]
MISLPNNNDNSNHHTQSSTQDELERYLQLPIVTNENIDPLNWWKTHQTEFP